MRSFAGAVLASVAMSLLAGCASTMNVPPSGVSPGFLFSEVTYPSARESNTQFKFKPEDIVVLGPVKASSESMTILMLWSSGDNGYGNLMRAARAAYPEADGVIDVQWDTQYGNLCIPCWPTWLPIMIKAKSFGEGQAFKFKK